MTIIEKEIERWINDNLDIPLETLDNDVYLSESSDIAYFKLPVGAMQFEPNNFGVKVTKQGLLGLTVSLDFNSAEDVVTYFKEIDIYSGRSKVLVGDLLPVRSSNVFPKKDISVALFQVKEINSDGVV